MIDKKKFLVTGAVCLLAAIPFLVVRFPPITDLPQHAAQIRLFGETIGNPDSPYKIQWLTPYHLVYMVIGAAWAVFGPDDAGRVGMLLIVILSIVMIHLLAARQKRSAFAAALASVLFFSHILYWGFYQFAFGWPVFMGFLLLLEGRFRNRAVEALSFFGIWLVLYFSHVLWFFLAVFWLGVDHLFLRRDVKSAFFRGAGALPLAVLAAVWYPTLSVRGFRSETIWATMPFERLSPAWLVDAAFGGLRGSVEYVFSALLLFWILAAWFSNKKDFRRLANMGLLVLGGLFFLLALILPDEQTNTIRFSQRWLPPAVGFFLLGLPEVRIQKRLLGAIVFSILVSFFVLTSLNWMAFERSELSGLSDALGALPSKPRVIGLSYLKNSAIVRGRPFIQVFSYAQVYRGGELNFSFADFAPSLVVYRRPRILDWTSGLEWLPQQVTRKDFGYFDFALISGDEKLHAAVARDEALAPVTYSGLWRLYKVSAATRR